MLEASQTLVELLDGSRVDEAAALEQVDRVLTLERRIKRAQLALLIDIKNILTPEQQDRLRSLRGDGR
jgi:Spy/CpxP family protein refolding chaperone